MNSSGRRVSEALAHIEDAYDEPELQLRELLATSLLDEGRGWRDELTEITHEELHPRDFDVAGMRAWLREAWSVEGQIQTVRMGLAEGETPQETLGRIRVGEWVRQSGMSSEEAAAYFKQLMDEGKPLPWEESSPQDS